MPRRNLILVIATIVFIFGLQFCSEAQDLDEDLAMHLPFDEGTGDTAEDHSNFQNDGTLEGADWVDGKINKAVSFDGASYVGVMPGQKVGIGQATTWALWFKTDVDGQTAYLAVLHGTMTVTLSGGNIQAQVWTSTWNTVNSQFKAIIGEWHHVAVTWTQESSEITIYVNGNEEASAPAAGGMSFKSGRQLAIGANDQLSYAGDGLFTGVIDDFRIYNRALSEVEITELIAGDMAVSFEAKLAVTWGGIKK